MNETELEKLVVRLTGDASSYQKMTRDASQATEGLNRTVQGTSGRLAVMSQRVNAFGLQLRGYGMQMAAVGAALVGVGGATKLVMDSVRAAASAESVEMAFKSLIGNAELAQHTLKELRQFAAETPFEQPEILAAAKQMIAFGESAQNIVPTMRSLGDVSSALQVPLGSLTYLFGTLKSQGRAFTVDINQFAMRGIPIWKELEKQFGKTNAEVRKMVEGGQVGFADVEQAFKRMTGPGGQFFNMMKEQSGTLPGLFSTMKDNIGMAMTDVGKIIIEEFSLKEITKTVGEMAGTVVDVIKSIPKDVIKVASSFAAGLAVATALVAVIVALKVGIGAVVALVAGLGPFGIAMIATFVVVGAAIAGVVHHLGGIGPTLELLKKKAQEAWEWLAPVRQAVVNLGETVGQLLSQAWETVKVAAADAWEAMFGDVELNWEEVRRVAVRAIQFIEFSLLNMGKVSEVVWARLRYDVERVKNNLSHLWTVVLPAAIKHANGLIINYALEAFARVKAVHKDMAHSFIQANVDMFAGARDLLREFIQFHVDAIRKIPEFVSGAANILDFFLPGSGKDPATLGRKLAEQFLGAKDSSAKAAEEVGKQAGEAMSKGFVVPKRDEGELERQLREEWEKARDGLMQSFEEFVKHRQVRDAFRRMFGGAGGQPPPLPITEQIKQLNKEAKDAKGSLQDLEAIISGSNKSRAVMARHLSGINVMNRFVPGPATGTKSETLLDQISKNTKDIVERAAIIIEAGF